MVEVCTMLPSFVHHWNGILQGQFCQETGHVLLSPLLSIIRLMHLDLKVRMTVWSIGSANLVGSRRWCWKEETQSADEQQLPSGFGRTSGSLVAWTLALSTMRSALTGANGSSFVWWASTWGKKQFKRFPLIIHEIIFRKSIEKWQLKQQRAIKTKHCSGQKDSHIATAKIFEFCATRIRRTAAFA